MIPRRSLCLGAALCALLVLAAPAQAARTLTFRAGPYKMGGYHTTFIKEQVRSPDADGFVTGMSASLVDRRGRRVTIRDGMLHHVFFKNLDVMRVAGHCSARQPEVFFSTGEEDERLDLPAGYGYRLRADDRWLVNGMLMSHRMKLRTVYIRYRVRLTMRPLAHVRPLWVRANGCGPASAYDVEGGGEPGSRHVRTHAWRVPVSGRIVAAGGHLHAGAIGLEARQPDCANRRLWDNTPRYGPPGSLPYTVRPLLHEAGPVDTAWWSSRTGVSVRAGDRISVHGIYDGRHARGQVMAITHVYLAPDGSARGGCAPLPGDARVTRPPPGTRPSAPHQPIPLWKLDRDGEPVQLPEPEARAVEVPNGFTVALGGFAFRPENVIVRVGDTLRWRFADTAPHNLTFASGPRAIGGQTGRRGQAARTTFGAPGRYQLFCYLHPMTMRGQVLVRLR